MPQQTFEIEYIPIDQIHPDPANPRVITVAELDALERSIREFGFVDPVLVRREDLSVIGGHQRLTVARRMGLLRVPVIKVDIDLEQARMLNLALNKIAGSWDEVLLARLFDGLRQDPGRDLFVTGFNDSEVKALLRSLDVRERRVREETFDFAAALDDARAPATTQPGDVIRLGEHVLVCGDATQASDLTCLLDGERPAMAFTDPPYNVDYEGGTGRRRRGLANDALSPDEWATFVSGWTEQLMQHVDGAVYVCMSSKEMPTVALALAAVGGHWSDTLIWYKDRFTLGRADYQRQYEPIWYGWREGAKHQWHGDRDQGDVWTVPRPAQSPLHSTMKPLALIERAIENSSSDGDLVLDLFLGSGSTLIAAERTGRRCRGVEVDPHYCDVIVARWEAFSGRSATRPER